MSVTNLVADAPAPEARIAAGPRRGKGTIVARKQV